MSAGKSVQITLPKNEVQLNAFVLPEAEPGKISCLGNISVSIGILASVHLLLQQPCEVVMCMWAHICMGTGGNVLPSCRSEALCH